MPKLNLEHGKSNKLDIHRLWGKQKEILRMVASGLYTNKEIANTLGCSQQTVTNILRSALGQQTVEMLQGAADQDCINVMSKLNQLAPIAVAVQEEMLLDENTDPKLKHRIADKIIDRNIGTPVARSISMNLNQGLSREDLDKIKNRAKEIQQEMQEAEVVQ